VIEEWPVDVSTIKSLTIPNLKKYLKKYGISTGLGRRKEDLLTLFQKDRCCATEREIITCTSEEDICDLRNNLCRSDIHNTLPPNGTFRITYKGKTFLVDNDMKKILLHHEALDRQAAAARGAGASSTSTTTTTDQTSIPPPPPPLTSTTTATSSSSSYEPCSFASYFDTSQANDQEIRQAVLACFGLTA
jgi:hypothetical protein